ELALIDHVAAAGDTAAKLKVLVDEAPQVLRVSWCTVLHSSDGGVQPLVGSPGAPETGLDAVPWMPIEHAIALDAAGDWVPQLWRELDTTLMAAPLGAPDTAVMLGRPGGPAFRPSEVARLGYLAGIVGTLLH
ncbi:MAG TPA: amino acid-binding protein, partial [Mycobacterium sp.]|nr:amino acid-binding protein [Mycobacterium sp.]